MALLSYFNNALIEAGCDEAGRGPLAGPVFAAAVILPQNFYHPLLNDSKKMSAKHRYLLRGIIEQEAISYGVAMADAAEIDELNILNASILAIHRAIDKLSIAPEFLLIDGNRFKPYKSIPYTTIVKGDGKYCSIAAASVLAKTYRDDYMLSIAKDYPFYGWDKNMGYPTDTHIQGILQHGYSPYHRRSFQDKRLQKNLFDL